MFVRKTREFIADAGRQLTHQLGDFSDRLAGTDTWCGASEYLEGCVFVVVFNLLRPNRPTAGHEGIERYHRPAGVTDIPFAEVIGLHARIGITLHINILYPAFARELVDIFRGQCAFNGCVDIGVGDAERISFLAIDMQLELRRIFKPVRPHAGQEGIFCGHGQQLITRGEQAVMAQIAAVLQLYVESAGIAEGQHRWRQDE